MCLTSKKRVVMDKTIDKYVHTITQDGNNNISVCCGNDSNVNINSDRIITMFLQIIQDQNKQIQRLNDLVIRLIEQKINDIEQ